MFLVLLLLAGVGIGLSYGIERGLLGGFLIAATAFLLSEAPLFRRTPADLRKIAASNDANRLLLLGISLVVSAVVVGAVTSMLTGAQSLPLFDKLLVTFTLAVVWFFANGVYAIHYAHLYYLPRSKGGLQFPGGEEPDFSDFVHFAFTIGVAVQTADIQITDRRIRRVVTGQAIAGFFFNLFVLALTVNVLAGSGQG